MIDRPRRTFQALLMNRSDELTIKQMIWKYGAEEVIAAVIRQAPKKWGMDEDMAKPGPVVPPDPEELEGL
jgi:hypothetical protein